jgi:hypothetical protein
MFIRFLKVLATPIVLFCGITSLVLIPFCYILTSDGTKLADLFGDYMENFY